MAEVQSGNTVTIHYTGKTTDGTVFDTSTGAEPLEIKIGQGEFWPTIEEALIGMTEGEVKTIDLEADQAIPYFDELVFKVPRSEIPADIPLNEGIVLQLSQQDGKQTPVTVKKVEEEHVTLDANHPLAGTPLTFVIEVVTIKS